MQSSFRTSLLGPREDNPDSEIIVRSSPPFSPINQSSYQSMPTARHFEPAGLNFLMMTTAITWVMLPGVGFFYSGLARQKSALSLMIICLWACAIVSVQWYLIGFSLCLSDTGGKLIGNLDHLLLRDIGDRASFLHPKVPLLLVSVWYCLFAAITPTVFLGGIAERARFLPTIIFIFLWTTLVFDFLCYWTWNQHGWSLQMGALDFGGGTPVHISSGASALAFAYMVGKRENAEELLPQNMNNVYLGTCFIWCGWLVANAGSGLFPHFRAVTVFVTTNLAASTGGITGGVIDYVRHGRKWSALGFCTGAISGLVCITPASGFVTPSSSLLFGFLGALCCNFAISFKKFLRVDDAFDVFACHGVGGIVGNLLTGVFAQKAVAAVDGQRIRGGWLDGHWEQVGYQAIDCAAAFAWSFMCTIALLFFIDKFPGLHLRASPEDQEIGLDRAELGVAFYEHLDDLCSGNNFNHNNNNNNGNFPMVKTLSVTDGGGPQASPQTAPPASQNSPNVITIRTINGDMNGYGPVPGSAPNNLQNNFIRSNGYINGSAGHGMMVMANNGFIMDRIPGTNSIVVSDVGGIPGVIGEGEAVLAPVAETTEHM